MKSKIPNNVVVRAQLKLWRVSVAKMKSKRILVRWQKKKKSMDELLNDILSLETPTILPTGCVWRLGDTLRIDDTTNL